MGGEEGQMRQAEGVWRLRVCEAVAALVWVVGFCGCAATIPETALEDMRQIGLRERFQTAWFLCAQRETKQAEPELKALYKEMKLEDDIADDVIFWLGYCHEENGEHQEAINRYHELLGLYPKSSYAAEAREKVARLRKGKGEE